jgi:hypothetical protein
VDASIVPVPKQLNSPKENEAVKHGETPAEWERKPKTPERQRRALDQEA